jgi:hypothetical protein
MNRKQGEWNRKQVEWKNKAVVYKKISMDNFSKAVVYEA